MKKILLLLFIFSVSISCKENNSKENKVQAETNLEKDEKPQTSFDGEFIYVEKDNAAVLKGRNFIYGVNLNGKALELVKQVSKIKKDEYDMVPVKVEGDVTENNGLQEGEEGWEKILTITKIVSVSPTPAPADIKIEENKN